MNKSITSAVTNLLEAINASGTEPDTFADVLASLTRTYVDTYPSERNCTLKVLKDILDAEKTRLHDDTINALYGYIAFDKENASYLITQIKCALTDCGLSDEEAIALIQEDF